MSDRTNCLSVIVTQRNREKVISKEKYKISKHQQDVTKRDSFSIFKFLKAFVVTLVTSWKKTS